MKFTAKYNSIIIFILITWQILCRWKSPAVNVLGLNNVFTESSFRKELQPWQPWQACQYPACCRAQLCPIDWWVMIAYILKCKSIGYHIVLFLNSNKEVIVLLALTFKCKQSYTRAFLKECPPTLTTCFCTSTQHTLHNTHEPEHHSQAPKLLQAPPLNPEKQSHWLAKRNGSIIWLTSESIISRRLVGLVICL